MFVHSSTIAPTCEWAAERARAASTFSVRASGLDIESQFIAEDPKRKSVVAIYSSRCSIAAKKHHVARLFPERSVLPWRRAARGAGCWHSE
jgi:hypothetical protein